MTMIKKLFLWVGGVVTLLLIFWVVDLPQTVRLKAAIVRMLPLDPESTDSTIRNLCAGSHSGSAETDCYLAFRSEEAVNAIADDQARKRKCQQIAQRIESGEEKSWQRQEPRSREEIMELLKPLVEEGEPDRKLVRGAPEPRFAALFLCWR
jgi:predicted component of type VI protein secretion system